LKLRFWNPQNSTRFVEVFWRRRDREPHVMRRHVPDEVLMDVAGDDHGVRQPVGADEIEHGLSVEWIPAHFSPPRVRIAGSALVSLGAKGTWLASRFHRAVDRSGPSINHACCAAPWLVRAGSSALGQ
jgi:hypothetical protein